MDIIVNGGVAEERFAFRVGGDTPRDVESATLTNGQVVIGDTGTPAHVGDFFRAIEGPLAFQEIPITAVSTNSFTIATTTLPVVTDEFYIMRFATQRVDETGSQATTVNSGPIQFVLDGADTEVEEDTATPGNSIPLPIKVMDGGGIEVDFATEAKQDVQITEAQTANASLAVIEAIDFATATKQDAQTALLTTIDADTGAIATSTASIDSKVLTDTQLRATPVPVSGPLTDTQLRATPVDVSVSSSALPTGAATAANQTTEIGLLTTIDADTGAIATSVASIDTKTPALGQALAAASVPVVFPVAQAAALAQETTLAAASAKLPAALGQTTSAASLAVVPASDYIPPSSAVPASVTVKQASITVGTSAVRLTTDAAAPSATRRVLNFMVDPASTAGFWYGSSGVTSSDGIPAFPGQNLKFDNDPNDYYIISDAAAQAVRIVEAE